MTAPTIEELHASLKAGVEALVSSEDWTRMLDTAARFHRYSFANALLILTQRPDATQVAGYRTWQGLGRQVSKGEHGIRILAPRFRKEEAEDGTEERRLVGFLAVSVFDVEQTTGDPLPSESLARQLEGDAPARLWDALAAQVHEAGFRIERAVPSIPRANGETDWSTRTIVVRQDVAAAQAAKTLAHELAHALLHEGSSESRERREVEAESVAYIVCSSLGLATDDYSFGYVAGWSGGDVDALQATGERVVQTAKRILERIEDGSEQEAA